MAVKKPAQPQRPTRLVWVVYLAILVGVCYGIYDSVVLKPEQRAIAKAEKLNSPVTNDELVSIMNIALKFQAAGLVQPKDLIIQRMQNDCILTYGELNEIEALCEELQRNVLYIQFLMGGERPEQKKTKSEDRQT